MNWIQPPSQENTGDHDSGNVVEQNEDQRLAAGKSLDPTDHPSTDSRALDAGGVVVHKKDSGVLVDGTVNATDDSGPNPDEASGVKEDSHLVTGDVVDLSEPGTLDTQGVVDHKDDHSATVSDAMGFTGDFHVASSTVADSKESNDLNAGYSGNSGDHKDDTTSRQSPLSHPRPTSHGTYVEGGNNGFENLEYYEEGGYHPVHLGDHLGPNKRYRVIHKLGHGGFGTVWLCRDNLEEKYVAVKVMTSDTPPDKRLDLSFTDVDRSRPGAEYIAFPLDHFQLTGPNREHHCVVLPILGPCASPSMWDEYKNPGSVLRNMCKQATEGLRFLHDNGICHGGSYFSDSLDFVGFRAANKRG